MLTYTKARAKTQTLVDSPKAEAADLVDNLGNVKVEIETARAEIADQLKNIERLEAEQAELEAALGSTVDQFAETSEGVEVKGQQYSAKVGKRTAKTEIAPNEELVPFLDNIDPALFPRIAKVGVTDLKKYLTPDQLEQVTETLHVGKRRITNLKGR